MVKYSGFRIRKVNKFYNRNRKFSKYINKKKSATAQQNQIRTLNKKINRVYKAVKPEIQTVQYKDSTALSNNPTTGQEFQIPSGQLNLPAEIKGQTFKYCYLNMRFFFNSLNRDIQRACTARLIIVQNKIPLDDVPEITDLMDDITLTQQAGQPFRYASSDDFMDCTYQILMDKADHNMYEYKKILKEKMGTSSLR